MPPVRYQFGESPLAMARSQKEILKRTIEALETSLARYPANEKIIQQLTYAYAQSGRFDPDARQVYEQAASLFPSDVKIQRALSISWLVSQSSDIISDVTELEAIDQESLQQNIERLKKLTREFPDSPFIYRALGDMQLIQGEEREAIQHYRCAMALGLTDLDPLCRHFEIVRRLRELSGHSAVFCAECYQRLNRVDKANQLYEDYVNGPRPERIVLEKYADFLRRRIEELTDDEDALSYSLRQLTRVALMKGNSPEALSWARQLTPEQLSEDKVLVKRLARVLIDMEDFRQAFEYLSRIPLDGETKSYLNEMAVMLEKRGELDTAVYILQFINENDEYSRQTQEYLQQEAQSKDQMIEIETELQMAELNWKNRRWLQSLERYLRVLELGYPEYRAILEPLDLLVEKVKNQISLDQLSFLTNFFADKREWRRCMKYAAMGLELDPNQAALSQRLLQSCERILLENPNECEVRLLHGDEHLRLGNFERALAEYRHCAEIPEYSMKANRRLAVAMLKAGDLHGSYDRFEALPILVQEDLERLYDLMIAFYNSQQHKDAYNSAKLILDYDKEFRDVQEKADLYEEKMNEGAAGFQIDPKMRELIGDHAIGRYKYVGKIGSGGMGVVHKVMDLKSDNVVAMKILREGLSSSGKAIDRFFREARIAATLRHKNIVNIFDYNISNNYGQSYIAMEFIDGPSLRDIIEQKFSETVDIALVDVLQALDWVSQLCDALDATHKKGIIHRDIKPDNIMIGKGNIVKITDFGIVHIEEATFTPTGALIGTPRYMSPEQVHGGRIDARSDIYSSGIILYELLIGSPPFISGDISYQQVNVQPTPPKEICQIIPEAVDKVIMKCLEKSPADRFQSALECKQLVDEAYIRLGGDPKRLRTESQIKLREEREKSSSPATVQEGILPRAFQQPSPLAAKAAQKVEKKEELRTPSGSWDLTGVEDNDDSTFGDVDSDLDSN